MTFDPYTLKSGFRQILFLDINGHTIIIAYICSAANGNGPFAGRFCRVNAETVIRQYVFCGSSVIFDSYAVFRLVCFASYNLLNKNSSKKAISFNIENIIYICPMPVNRGSQNSKNKKMNK